MRRNYDPAAELDAFDAYGQPSENIGNGISYGALRAKGTNPRAKRTNPRAAGTNPTAGLDSDEARVARHRRRAMARLKVRGDVWCSACADIGVRPVWYWVAGECQQLMTDCICRPMTLADADEILGLA